MSLEVNSDCNPWCYKDEASFQSDKWTTIDCTDSDFAASLSLKGVLFKKRKIIHYLCQFNKTII